MIGTKIMSSCYLDSCIIIYLIQGPEPLYKEVSQAFVPGEDPRSIYVSDLTRLECRVWPKREGERELLEQYDDFFALPEVIIISIKREVFDLATDLRATHRLRTPDAIHLAAAIIGGCSESGLMINGLQQQRRGI